MAEGYINPNSRYRVLEDASQNYGFDNIVYIRGTKEGYENVRPLIDKQLQSTRIKNRIKAQAQGMLSRYAKIRNEAYSLTSGSPINMSEDQIVALQEQWVDALSEGLDSANANFGEETATVMKKVQEALNTLSENGEKKTAEDIQNLVQALEDLFNTLPAEDKADLAGLIYDKQAIEGNIINVENGAIVFSRMKKTLEKMKELDSKRVSTYMRNMNREFGAIGEAMDTFALHQAGRKVQEMLGKDIGNLKVQQTGSSQTVDPETGKRAGTGTVDSLFTYEGEYDGSSLLFNFGVSLKTTGTVIGPDGRWIQKKDTTDIKIKTISAQFKMWNDILGALGSKSARTENSVLNTLVWSNANSNNYRIINKGLLAAFFEKYLSGGNRLARGTGIDVADAIMINGTPIPMTLIIAGVIDQLEQDNFLSKNQSLAFINLEVDNQWKGGKKNLTDAVERSHMVANAIKKTLSAKVYLNGNQLYNLAKIYINP